MTFKAQYNNAAAYNKWSDSDQLAQLKACLTLTAANVMWDSDPTDVDDLPRLWQTLVDRFGEARSLQTSSVAVSSGSS